MSKSVKKAVYFLNGPNANLYGLTDKGTYGSDTFETLQSRCAAEARRLSVELTFRQSNSEGQLIDWIQEAIGKADGVIIASSIGPTIELAIIIPIPRNGLSFMS